MLCEERLINLVDSVEIIDISQQDCCFDHLSKNFSKMRIQYFQKILFDSKYLRIHNF